jgi:hypothetical protein
LVARRILRISPAKRGNIPRSVGARKGADQFYQVGIERTRRTGHR